MKWHYSYQDAQHGPVTDEEIKDLIAAGNITPDNLVWCEGMAGWEPISNMPELMPVADANGANTTSEVVSHAAPAAVGNMSTYIEEPELSAPAVYSGFWRRFMAHFIDSILFSLVFIFLGFVVGMMSASGEANTEDFTWLDAISIVAGWLYYSLMESSSKQATIGKQLMDIKVTDIDGNRISFARASGRYFGKILSALILMIGYLMMLFTQKKQTLHDIMAGCLVVKSNQ